MTAGRLQRNVHSKEIQHTQMEEQMEESDRLQWEHDDLENIHERTRWKSMEFQCQDAYSDTETAAIKVTEYYDRA